MTRPFALLAPLLAGVLLLSGCNGLSGTGDKGYIDGNGQITEVAAADRGQPIELSGSDLDGRPLSVADHRGEVVVVNVWWSACPPCRTEMPVLKQVAAEREHDAAFIGVNIRDSDQAQAQAFVRRFEVPYPSLFDPSGQAMLAFSGTLSPRSVPATVVLDPQGRVAATVLGAVPTAQTLNDLIDDASDGGGTTDDG